MSRQPQLPWATVLNLFTERNGARLMDLDVLSEELGAQPGAVGMPLHGVTFDHHDARVEIMLGTAGVGHITHSIGGVTAVEVARAADSMGDVLSIRHEGGRTILRPSPPSRLASR